MINRRNESIVEERLFVLKCNHKLVQIALIYARESVWKHPVNKLRALKLDISRRQRSPGRKRPPKERRCPSDDVRITTFRTFFLCPSSLSLHGLSPSPSLSCILSEVKRRHRVRSSSLSLVLVLNKALRGLQDAKVKQKQKDH